MAREDDDVPTWNGDPSSFKHFATAVEWWKESLNLKKLDGVNIAARLVRKQTGAAKTQGEEFQPHELRAKPELWHEQELVQAAEPFAGVDLLMASWRAMCGQNLQERKADVLEVYHKKL